MVKGSRGKVVISMRLGGGQKQIHSVIRSIASYRISGNYKSRFGVLDMLNFESYSRWIFKKFAVSDFRFDSIPHELGRYSGMIARVWLAHHVIVIQE